MNRTLGSCGDSAPRPRSLHSHGQPQKFPCHFFAAPPPTPPPKGDKKKGNFGLRRRFSLQKLRKVIIFPNSAFSSFPSARGAPVARVRGSSSVRSHYANTSHRPLTFVRVVCSVLLRVRSVASLEFVVFIFDYSISVTATLISIFEISVIDIITQHSF